MKHKQIIISVIIFTLLLTLFQGCDKCKERLVVHEKEINSTLDLTIIYQFERMKNGSIVVLGENKNNEINCYVSKDNGNKYNKKKLII